MESSTITIGSTASLACRNCARTTEFEQPPCLDGHGADCPEWYCTECGAATILDRQRGRRWPNSGRQPLGRATRRA